MTEKKRVSILLIVSICILVGIMVFLLFYERTLHGNKLTESTSGSIAQSTHLATIPETSLSAKAAYVFDVMSGEVLYAKNEEAQLPLASLSKLMTTIVASEYLKPNDVIAIHNRDLGADGDSGLESGERWSAQDLLSFTLIVSANDGALALARAAGEKAKQSSDEGGTTPDISVENFVDLMNKKAQAMGLTQTYFLNPTGLDTTIYTSGGYGSAHDVATMLIYAIRHDLAVIEPTSKQETTYQTAEDNTEHVATNTNPIVDNIPGLIASKTGFTDLAGGNLAVAFDAGVNHPIVVVVLGSTFEGRFSDVQTLVNKTLQTLALQ